MKGRLPAACVGNRNRGLHPCFAESPETRSPSGCCSRETTGSHPAVLDPTEILNPTQSPHRKCLFTLKPNHVDAALILSSTPKLYDVNNNTHSGSEVQVCSSPTCLTDGDTLQNKVLDPEVIHNSPLQIQDHGRYGRPTRSPDFYPPEPGSARRRRKQLFTPPIHRQTPNQSEYCRFIAVLLHLSPVCL